MEHESEPFPGKVHQFPARKHLCRRHRRSVKGIRRIAMPLLLLLLLTVACLPENWPLPYEWGSQERALELSSALTWGGVILVVAAAAAMASWVRWSIQTRPEARESILRRCLSWKFY